MKREEVEAVAADFDTLAAQGRHTDGYLNAARILRKALAESEAPHPPADARKTLFVDAHTLVAFGSPISAPRPLPQAGPGLWSIVAFVRIGGQPTYRIEVVPA